MPRIPAILTAVSIVTLAGCASGGPAAPQTSTPQTPTGTPAEQRALARYTAYAGPPIPYFVWLGHFWSWEALGKDTLAVYTTPGEAYLLKVWPPCDLRFVIDAIGITSTARTVYAHTDSITVNSAGTGPGRWRCPIDEIRKIDLKRMKADQRAQAQQNQAQANQGAPPPGDGKQ
jgi:Family of unknown function (DUF6491)